METEGTVPASTDILARIATIRRLLIQMHATQIHVRTVGAADRTWSGEPMLATAWILSTALNVHYEIVVEVSIRARQIRA